MVWNPFSLETITSIDRLGGPVIDVHVSESDKSDAGKVIALIGSTMREIRVYDSVSFTLLQTVCDSLHANSQKGRSCLSAMLYIPHEDQFYTAGMYILLPYTRTREQIVLYYLYVYVYVYTCIRISKMSFIRIYSPTNKSTLSLIPHISLNSLISYTFSFTIPYLL